MEINLDCSDIINNEFSEFLDNNSQICINQEEGEVVGAQLVEVNISPTINLQPLKTEDVVLNFQEDFEEIKQTVNEDSGEADAFFMKDLSPIRAAIESQDAPLSAAVESIRALGTTSNPQIKKLFSYQGQNEPQNKSVEMIGAATGNSNSRKWVKQPEFKAKVIGTQMMKPPVHFVANKDLKAETTNLELSQAQALTLDSNREMSSTGNLPNQVLGSTATSTIPSNKQWQKVSIAKRRPITAALDGQQKNGQRSTSTSSIISKPKMPINISNIQNSDMEDNQPRTYRELIISSPNIKQCQASEKAASNVKKRKKEPGEIVPLFDCLFCCQEHFVLEKLLEKNITRVYANNTQNKNKFMINLYINQHLTIEQTLIQKAEEPQINSFAQSTALINQLSKQNLQYQTPISIQYSDKVRILRSKIANSAISSQKSIVPRLKLPITPVENIPPQLKNLLNMAELDDSAIYLEDGTELLGARHRLKTRRQRIIEQISFETDSHNIYDPYFTSEEEGSQSPLKLQDVGEVSRLPAMTSRRKLQTQYEPSSSSINSLGSNYESSESEKLGEESFSSIEKGGDNSEEQIDGVFGTSTVFMQLEPIAANATSEQKPNLNDGSIEVQQQIFMATNILNIQENKFAPEQDEKESQRYTFGCITPKGISLAATGAFPQQLDSVNSFIKNIAAISQPTQNQESIGRQKFEDRILSGSEQSPFPKEDQKTIEGFSPLILEINQNPGSRRMTTENPLYSEDQESKINFHPPSQLLESLEDGNNFTRFQVQPIQRIDNLENDSCDDMSLKMTHQAMVQNFMSSAEPLSRVVHHKPTKSLSQAVGTLANQNSKEEDCFSPIRHENSISRDCIQAVVAVREAIQVPIFNSIEYYEGDHSSIPRYNERIESQHQTSNQLFGNKDILTTSNFPNNFRLSSDPAMFNPLNNFSASMEKSDLNGSQPFQCNPSSLERQPINMGQNAAGGFPPNSNHSFSAFNTKHLMVNHHQTPQVLHREGQQLIHDTAANYSNPSMSIGGANNNHQFKTLVTDEDQNGLSAAVRNRKKSGKKYIIKQDQLDQLLLQAFLHKQANNNNTVQETTIAAHSSSDMNLKPCNASSSGYMQLQFFDSIVKQPNSQASDNQNNSKAVNISDQQQPQQMKRENSQLFDGGSGERGTSNNKQGIVPKHHKKKQKTQDYNKTGSQGGSQKQNPLAYIGAQAINNQSTQNINERRAPKMPATSIGQNSRKMTATNHQNIDELTYSNKVLHNDNPSRQHAMSGNSRGGKNYHLSFNNVIQNSQIAQKKILEGSNDPEQDRPLTLRNNYRHEESEKNRLEVSPNLLLKASKNFNQPINQAMFAHHFKNQGELTQEEMTQFLKSAICSSRYSSSSATGGQVPGFAGYIPNNMNAINFGLIKQMSIDNSHPMMEVSAKNRDSNSNLRDDHLLTVSPKKKLRKPNHFKQEPLLTEGTDFTAIGDNTTLIPHHHHHQLSIDNQTTIHKSSGKINERRDSSIRASNGNFGGGLKRNNDSQKALFRKPYPQQPKSTKGQKTGNDLSGSLEKIPSRKMLIERAASGKHQRVKKFIKNNNETIGSKERSGQQQKVKKTKSQATKQPNLQYQQQKDFQSYLNLFNSINFSNELSIPPHLNPQGSQSNLHVKALNFQGPQSTSMINENTYATKNLYNSNVLNPQNASSIIPNQNHHYYNNNHFTVNTGTNQVDTSQNNVAPLITSGAAHTSGAQFEMSTTISNNQLSLTRLASGVNRGNSNGKGNQTISSGGQNQSQVNQTTTMMSKKVVIPQLQLNKIKSSSSKRANQLNGSQDEIQLQSLLLNLNQHLQANPYQTRVSQLKEGSNTVQTTPHGGQNAKTSFQKGISAAAAVAQSQVINTKRSQASSLSQQRLQNQPIEVAKSSSIPFRNQDNITIDQSTTERNLGVIQGKSNQAQLLKQLDFSVQNLKKKQEVLALIVPPLNLQQALTSTAAQKERRQKSKDVLQVPQSAKNLPGSSPQTNNVGTSITKKILQNSFTLKQLKLMNAAKVNMLTTQQQQFTGRQMDSQRPTERTVSNNNRTNPIVSMQPENIGGGTCRGANDIGVPNKEKSSQKKFTKLLIKNQKHIMSNTRAQQDDIVKIQQQLNRSSLNPTKELQIPTGKLQSRPSFPISKKKPEVDLRLQSNMTLNLSTIAPQPKKQEIAANRFYDTGRQTLISQVASPHKHLGLLVSQVNQVSQTQVPTLTQVSAIQTKVQNTKGMTTALGSKNSVVQSTTNFNQKHQLNSNQFSLKSIFTKNNPQNMNKAILNNKQKQQMDQVVQQNAPRESLQ